MNQRHQQQHPSFFLDEYHNNASPANDAVIDASDVGSVGGTFPPRPGAHGGGGAREMSIPKRVFVVPYRHRAQHKFFFVNYMQFLLEDVDPAEFEIYFAHQADDRPFNRGAVKNIGFMAIKKKYPHHYRDITIIFNDVDTIPFNKLFSYETLPGTVAHYYGYTHTLGGIVVIKGGDFERVNGFPCFWGWSQEDNCLNARCLRAGLKIDRSNFYPIGSPEILQLFDGMSRIISKNDVWRGNTDNGTDGLGTLSQVSFSFEQSSGEEEDCREHMRVPEDISQFIRIATFEPRIPMHADSLYKYDLREKDERTIRPRPPRPSPREHPSSTHQRTQTHNKQQQAAANNWQDITYVQTTLERHESAIASLRNQGKPIGRELLLRSSEMNRREMETDPYNKKIVDDLAQPPLIRQTNRPSSHPHPHPLRHTSTPHRQSQQPPPQMTPKQVIRSMKISQNYITHPIRHTANRRR